MNDNILNFVNLASPKLGTRVVEFTDDFFGDVSRMLKDEDPIFIPDKYDNHGKWMDGWESRRKRTEGNDWSIIELGSSGEIEEIEIDTSHFTGNFPPYASLEGIYSKEKPKFDDDWTSILKKTELKGDKSQKFKVKSELINYVRFQIYPDGGVARLRLNGNVLYDFQKNKKDIYELSSLNLGGKIISYNNAHYGDVSALLSEGRGKTMGDGWETRRRRTPGNDWIIIKLAHTGLIKKIEIDTAHFKGNFPDRASIQCALINDTSTVKKLIDNSVNWKEILSSQKLKADNIHTFSNLNESGPVNYVKLNIFPDGGVSRLRILGSLTI
tara:strand:+ start:2045 stop:3022 length:978 start_codon:yes stop_codon:yes gene_type:complete